MTTELAEGVYVYRGGVLKGNFGVLLGSERAAVVDTSINLSDPTKMLNFVLGRGYALVSYVLLTHGHYDHHAGTQVFAPTAVIAHDEVVSFLQAEGEKEFERAKRFYPEFEQVQIVYPDITFQTQMSVYLGDKTLRIFHTPGHSPDSSCVLVEEDGILFTGDTVTTNLTPFFAQGDSGQLEESLRLIKQMEVRVLVPGHGELVSGAEVSKELDAAIYYLFALRDQVRRMIERGVSLEQMLAAVSYEECAGKAYEDVDVNRTRIRRVIPKMREEILSSVQRRT